MQRPDVGAVARHLARDDGARRALQKRVLTVVVISQVLGGAGLAAGITVGALLAEDMLGTSELAGLPSGLITLGAALAVLLVGRTTQRAGRRVGLGLGFAAGGLGAAGVVLAAVAGHVGLLFISLFAYGAGASTNLQARYAGTDLALPEQRGKAISVALVSTTFGAVAGPNLVAPLGDLATALGIPELAGPFLLAGTAYLAAGATLAVFLRPDPFLVARHLTVGTTAGEQGVGLRQGAGGGVTVGATIMVLTQVAMVAIMTMTPVHMRAHGHGLGAVGLVIGVHVAAMFLPSLVTGALVDRVGRLPMAIASGITLLLAGLTAALSPGDSLGMLIVALALLGLGWNFGLIAGTALVVDGSVPGSRARTQGNVDVLIALGGAGGGAMSGVVVAGSSFAVLALAGGVLSVLLIPMVARYRRHAAA